ncbi:Phosphate acyltransferase [bioreactor metagenome]|uniref:phosphate acyltransferase n=1 Tax=bioreactor metagenome TaxID=1076179 RepID=A0A645FXG3_9ZZZZ
MPGLKKFKKKLDYKEYGGTIFLGISKPVIKAHGSSDSRAFCSAIKQAISFVEMGVIEGIASELGNNGTSPE